MADHLLEAHALLDATTGHYACQFAECLEQRRASLDGGSRYIRPLTCHRGARRHMLRHATCTYWVCDWPGCLFPRWYDKTNWRRHRVTHTGEKPVTCHWPGCRRRYTQHSSLKAHYRVDHLGWWSRKRKERPPQTNLTGD